MADFITSFDNSPIMSSSSSSGAADDNYEDACSICLEPFNTNDPATVTNCKHEYHLQCILEWSQRSKECPICWQLLVLKDPASQELLAAVENERSLRSRHNIRYAHGGYEIDREAFADDSDFDERIMRHFAAAASRACYVNKRGRHRSSGIGPSQVSFSVPTADLPDEQQMHPTSPEEWQSLSYGLLEGDSAASSTPTTIDGQYSSVVSSDVNVVPSTVGNRHGPTKPRVPCSQPPFDSPQRPSSSELLAFSDSIKSRFSAASVRYKESISRSTRGFKERLLARNVSVKELGRGVQREMNAGIAGVARMIERLDLTSKQAGASSPLSGTTMETSNISHKGKGVQESLISQSLNGNTGDTVHDTSLAAPTCICDTIPGKVEVSLAQCGK